MEKRNVETELFIEPQYFSEEMFSDYILKLLKEKEGTCTKEDGYLEHLYQIVDIQNKGLYDSGYCHVKVIFEASCFKPDIGKEVETTVEMVFPHGIFSSLYVLRFLVPYSSLKMDYDYIEDKQIYRHKKNTDEIIKVGSKININITDLKYNKAHFSCIAQLSYNQV